jgi:hypothetical protein
MNDRSPIAHFCIALLYFHGLTITQMAARTIESNKTFATIVFICSNYGAPFRVLINPVWV